MTWFDEQKECVVIAPPTQSTDYSVFAERDVTTSTARQGTLMKKQETSVVATAASASGTGTKDDEEGNVYINNDDL